MVDSALWLLRSIADKAPDQITDLFEIYIDKGKGWPNRINSALPWNIDDDSDRMFQIRLKLARIREYPPFIDWETFCKKHSFRAVLLIEAVLSTWSLNKDGDAPNSRIEKWYEKDAEAINTLINDFPKETWDHLLPHIERLTRFESDPYDPRQLKWSEQRDIEDQSIEFARRVVELAFLAGKKLAKESPKVLLQLTQFFRDQHFSGYPGNSCRNIQVSST